MVIKEGDLAYSTNTYIADGTTNTFPLAFTLGILSRSHVTCRVNEEEDGLGAPLYRPLTWLSDTLVTVQGTIADGDTVVFYRTVPKDALNQVYSDGSGLSDDALNNNNKHLIMIAHEVMDGRFYFSGASYGWDMQGNRLYNLPAPVENSDAVTKQYADELVVASGNVPPPILLVDGNKPLVANNTCGYTWTNKLGPMSMHSVSLFEDLSVVHGGTGASTAGGARSNLGLGSIATQAADNVAITGGSISGITDIAIADGGTGASTVAEARTNFDVYSKAEVAGLVSSATSSVFIAAYQQAAGVGGGAGTLSLTAHELNTTVHNSIPGTSLSGNAVVNLPAGTYRIRGYITCYGGSAKALVYHNSSPTGIISSSGNAAGANCNNPVTFEGVLTSASAFSLSIRSIYSDTNAARKGVSCNLGGIREEYARLVIEKVA